MTHTPLIILASTSKPRKNALKRLQLPFTTVAPLINEDTLPNEDPISLVKRLAYEKAKAVAGSYPNALIIGGDQVAVINNQAVGKPKDHKDAIEQLKQASGKSIVFHHGICLLNAATKHIQTDIESTTVTFRQLSTEKIKNYLLTEQPYNCAGSIMAESLGIALIERISTDDPHSLFGLPLLRLVKMLEKEGVDIIKKGNTYKDE